MEWDDWQTAVSAELDGEDPMVDRAALRAFEAANPATADWLAGAHQLNRAMRLGSVPGPLPAGFVDTVLSHAPATATLQQPGTTGAADSAADDVADDAADGRPAVVALRAGITVLAASAVLMAGPHFVLSLRLGQPLGAQWAGVSLAVAASLAYAAWRPRRCGPVAVLLALAGVLALVSSSVGVAGRQTSWSQETHHLAWMLGAMLVGVLHLLHRPHRTDRTHREPPARRGTARRSGPVSAGR